MIRDTTYPTVADLDERHLCEHERHTLVTDDLEVEHIFDSFGTCPSQRMSLFVRTKDGDYDSVLAFDGIVPYNNKPLYRIR